jgi:hypothetical protein
MQIESRLKICGTAPPLTIQVYGEGKYSSTFNSNDILTANLFNSMKTILSVTAYIG